MSSLLVGQINRGAIPEMHSLEISVFPSSSTVLIHGISSIANVVVFPYTYVSLSFPQIVNRHGPEADRHLLRCLFSHVDFSGDGKSSGKDFHQVNPALEELLAVLMLQFSFW